MASNTSIPTCSICLEVFIDPRFIVCGHSFCYECCEKNFYKERNRVCPLCQKRVYLPPDCDDLTKNWELAKVLEIPEEKDSATCTTSDALGNEDASIQEKLLAIRITCFTCEKSFPAMDIYSCEEHQRKDICAACCMRFHKKCDTTSLEVELLGNYDNQLRTAQMLKSHFSEYADTIDVMLLSHATCMSELEHLSDQLKTGQRVYNIKINKIDRFRKGVDDAICGSQSLAEIIEMMTALDKFNEVELKTYLEVGNDLRSMHSDFKQLWLKIRTELQVFKQKLTKSRLSECDSSVANESDSELEDETEQVESKSTTNVYLDMRVCDDVFT